MRNAPATALAAHVAGPAAHVIALAAPFLVLTALALMLAALPACERQQDPETIQHPAPPASQSDSQSKTASPKDDEAKAAAAEAGRPVILALGDSLTAGFGLAEEESYPARLQARLRAAGYPHRVVNAGVSGDTSAGGLARLDWLMRQHPNVIILALGANDGLRGIKPAAMRANLAAIIERAQVGGARVLLAGMRMPTNYGADFTRRFEAVYGELAEKYGLPLLPFLLEGVALQSGLNQADGIHPNAKGAAVLTDNVWRALEPLLEK